MKRMCFFGRMIGAEQSFFSTFIFFHVQYVGGLGCARNEKDEECVSPNVVAGGFYLFPPLWHRRRMRPSARRSKKYPREKGTGDMQKFVLALHTVRSRIHMPGIG